MEDKPLVSIITTSLNQGKFIEDTILSVKNQDYPNIEHIVVDGGSTDNTLGILKKYEGTYNMRWISEPDEGQSDAVNKGFRMAKGEIIGWLNSDDAYLSIHTISEVVQYFKKHGKAKIVCGDMLTITHDNKAILVHPLWWFPSYSMLRKRNVIFQPSTFFKQDIVNNYCLDKNLHYVMDHDFWLKIGKENKFHHLRKVLSCFRRHEDAKSVSQRLKMKNEDKQVRQKYHYVGERLNDLNPLISVLLIFLPIVSFPQALNLYRRSDFAFNINLPPMHEMVTKQLLLRNLLRKLGI